MGFGATLSRSREVDVSKRGLGVMDVNNAAYWRVIQLGYRKDK